MNIISNTCFGAYVYKFYLGKYKNPFIWNIIDYDSLYFLIKNYDIINFNNYKVYENAHHGYIKIDNSIIINYVHYKNKILKDNKKTNDVFVDDVCSYTKNKYIERIIRMKEDPIFIIQVQPNHKITSQIEKLLKIISLNSKYKVYIITKNKFNNIIVGKNIHIINEENLELLNNPGNCCKKYWNIISKTFH